VKALELYPPVSAAVEAEAWAWPLSARLEEAALPVVLAAQAAETTARPVFQAASLADYLFRLPLI